LAPAISDIAARYEASLTRIVSRWRAQEHATNPNDLGEFDSELIKMSDQETLKVATDEHDENQTEWTLPLDNDEIAHLENVRAYWYKLVGIYRIRTQHQAVIDHLAALKNKRQRRVARPNQMEVRRIITNSAKLLSPLGAGTIGNGGY